MRAVDPQHLQLVADHEHEPASIRRHDRLRIRRRRQHREAPATRIDADQPRHADPLIGHERNRAVAVGDQPSGTRLACIRRLRKRKHEQAEHERRAHEATSTRSLDVCHLGLLLGDASPAV